MTPQDALIKLMNIDKTYKKLTVLWDGKTRPYIKVPYVQLAKLSALLDEHQIENVAEENIYSFDGGPYMASVDLGWKTDIQQVQALLDEVDFS